ncbi:MAG: glycosyltransferase family 2 protein [Flavobacteriia bacterium]|nr:glycosyltransferase family 2 protein [Flavobacteriia bacterium]
MSTQIVDPQVSVVMCVYNAWPHLQAAVESVLASDGVDFEFIIVDDGSTDDGAKYLKELLDARIRVIHQENKGVAIAANVGVEASQSALIARFDSDDIMHPHRLKLQYDYLKSNAEVGVVASQVELMESNFDQTGLKNFVEWSNRLLAHDQMYENRFRDTPVINPSAMFRKTIWERYGGYLSDAPEDYEYWMRLFHLGVRFGKLDQTLVQWRDLSNRLTRSHNDYSEEAFREVKLKYFALEWERSEDRPIYIWGKNKQAARWVEGLDKRGIAVSGFVDFKPGDWKGIEVLDIPTALNHQSAFFIITVRDWKGVRLIHEAMKENGKTLHSDYIVV